MFVFQQNHVDAFEYRSRTSHNSRPPLPILRRRRAHGCSRFSGTRW